MHVTILDGRNFAPQNYLERSKTKKIIIFSKRKSSNFNKKKFKEIVHNDCNTPKNGPDTSVQKSIRYQMSENLKITQPFFLAYDQQGQNDHITKRRKQIRRKMVIELHNNNIRSKYDRQKKIQKLNGTISVNQCSKPIISKFYVRRGKDQQFDGLQVRYKKHSLPDLNKGPLKLEGSFFNSLQKRNKQKWERQIYQKNEQMDFKKTGLINGLKIYNPAKHNFSTLKSEDLDYRDNQLEHSQSQRDSHNINSLILGFSSGKKVIKNNYLQIRKRSLEKKQSPNLTELHGKSLIKLEKIWSSNKTNKNQQN